MTIKRIFKATAAVIVATISSAAFAAQEVTTAQQLQEIISKNNKVVVDFWSQSCPPCKRLAPHFQSVSQKRKDVTMVKVNVDSAFALSNKYNVTALPTLIFFKGGKEVGRRTGYMTETALNSAIDNVLK